MGKDGKYGNMEIWKTEGLEEKKMKEMCPN